MRILAFCDLRVLDREPPDAGATLFKKVYKKAHSLAASSTVINPCMASCSERAERWNIQNTVIRSKVPSSSILRRSRQESNGHMGATGYYKRARRGWAFNALVAVQLFLN